MSLDLYLNCKHCGSAVFDRNITHNLGKMAGEAGLYEVLWHPTEHGFDTAEKMIPALEAGIAAMIKDPERYKKLNPENGWGSYENLLNFAEEALAACKKCPESEPYAST